MPDMSKHGRYWMATPVHPEKIVDWFLGLHHYWFDESIGPNTFTGMRDLAAAYLNQWVETGELPPDNTLLEITLASKFTEWLNSSWTNTPPVNANTRSALVETAHAVDDWFAGRTHNGPEERAELARLARAAIALAEPLKENQ